MEGMAEFAMAQVGDLTGEDAGANVENALRLFANVAMPLELARARLLLAQVAAAEGRRAMSEFEKLGASRYVDEAAQFLRSVGVGGRTGPKRKGVLTRREEEVLRLVGEGLTNDEIASRLFISRRTAEHHVSNILAKIGAANRSEAVALAVRLSSEITKPRDSCSVFR